MPHHRLTLAFTNAKAQKMNNKLKVPDSSGTTAATVAIASIRTHQFFKYCNFSTALK